MKISDTLKKVGGLIFEFDDPVSSDDDFYKKMGTAKKEIESDSPPHVAQKTGEQILMDTPGPNLNEISAPATPSAPVVSADGSVDFKAIYSLAMLPASAITAEQILDLLATLPAALPIETRRQTVKVTLNAMAQSVGVTPESVVADASRKLAALDSYARSYAGQADEYVAKSEQEIASLQQEIERRKGAIEQAKSKQSQVTKACQSESARLDDILEFFSLDVAPSKYAPNP
ncbi:hypothetical protein BH11ARM1_BH11ARM1_07400 [soil metagenome]